MTGRRPWPRSPERYEVDEDGTVFHRGGTALTTFPDPKGYLRANVYDDSRGGKRIQIQVHVMVCETFHGPRPDGKQVAHDNGVKTDLRPGNLSWKTPLENSADSIRHGVLLASAGEGHHLAKLNPDKVRTIRAEHAGGASISDLARRFEVNYTAISQVVRGISWKHVT
jgi:hypothetical protein